MKTQKNKLTSRLLMALLAFTLIVPSLAQAGRGHQKHGHHHHHHHRHHQHNHHLGGYNYIYNQPRNYYRPVYPQAQYNYYPAPVYGFPPNMIGINSGNASFMLRF